jgi:type I restriction enzyme M protein
MKNKGRLALKEINQDSLFVIDHKDAYRQIRNYLAGRLVGATRDKVLLEELIKCLFCKLYLKKNQHPFIQSSGTLSLGKMYINAFEELKVLLPNVFKKADKITLDSDSLAYIDQKLETIEFENPAYDLFGDAYEAFTGSSIRGQEGQFFTPNNAVSLLVSIVDPRPGEILIDPACGSGGFLSHAARHMMALGAPAKEISANIYGVDKDRYLASLASAHLSIITLEPAKVFCADSLAWAAEEGHDLSIKNKMGEFDIVLTNPPFGARIISVSEDIQRSFVLGYRWRSDPKSGEFSKLGELQSSVPPQVLFIERCLSLVRQGGRVGMVVPESVISGPNYRYVSHYIRNSSEIKAVIGMPEALFKTSGKGGTHTKTCLLVLEKKQSVPSKRERSRIFMAEAHWCGHDSRGSRIERNDIPEIGLRYEDFRKGKLNRTSHLGYPVQSTQLVDNILSPRYYNPDTTRELSLLGHTHDLVKFGDLVDSGLIRLTTGDEVGKLSYGTGTVPFVRTSDISNWEIKIDPKHCVSSDIYKQLAKKQDVQEGDLLFVRDGTYLIGTCAFITKYDTHIVFQSHIYKIRISDHSKLSPYLLLAILSSSPVQHQIRAKRFTQDIIDSLGDRIYEIILPIPKNKALRNRVTKMVEHVVQERIEARELARKACLELIGKKAVPS